MNGILRSVRLWLGTFLFASLALTAAPAAAQWQGNWKACFKYSGGFSVPHTGTVDPRIDGDPTTDLGWTRAWRYVFNNGTPVHDVAVQVTKSNDNQFIWMSFEVNNDHAYNSTDTLVVVIDAGAGGKKLLEIKPLINGGVRVGPDPDSPATNVNLPQINYYATAALPFAGSSPVPASTRARTFVSGVAPNVSWRVVLKLSRTEFAIPASGNFGLYFNALVAQGPGTGPTALLNEYAWPVPANSSEYLSGSPTEVPPVARWGTASIDSTLACNGVFLNDNDIGTTNMPPSKLLIGQQNTIQATVRNNSISASGVALSAKKIKAKFKYAAFGMSQVWNDIPADSGSQNPTATIDIATAEVLQTKWTVPSGNTDFPDGGKTCILVELDTEAVASGPEDWTTTFVNRSAWNNFHYSTMSRLDAAPIIDARGWTAPPPNQKHRVELFTSSRIDAIDADLARKGANADVGQRGDDKVSGDPWLALARLGRFPVERNASFETYLKLLLEKNVRVSQMVYTMHGCRASGKFIGIDGVQHEICERVGSFGFGMRHAGLGAIDWSNEITGADVVGGDKTHLRLFLNKDERMTLKTSFTAEDRIEGICHSFRTASAGGLATAGFSIVGALVFWPRRRKGLPSDTHPPQEH